MQLFVLRRLLWAVVTLFGVSLVAFSILYIVPGDVAAMMAGPRASKEVRLQITHDLGLDRPLYVQYGTFIGRLLQGNLGTSWMYRQAVSEVILQHLPYTALLALAGGLCE